ncbi:hypothetical protein LSCM1_07433 [Leishmania martiniquensis]|uniref:Protein kinase domain-containing protein n=1 Tax=Leishmania martiniquensis TaxID=1580590 RepID=A0A836L3N2_9TRYP|nr:hypothetical protein LSCM1_07433 [Leishmania martiniquensis]
MTEHAGVAAMLPRARGEELHPHASRPHHYQSLQRQKTSSCVADCESAPSAAAPTAVGEDGRISSSGARPRPQNRRSRSIHITLRKTRSGSRPVNAQRDGLRSVSRDFGVAMAATGDARGRTPNAHQCHGSLGSVWGVFGDTASPTPASTAAGTPPGAAQPAPFTFPTSGGCASPQLTPRHHGAVSTSPKVTVSGAHRAQLLDDVANSNNNPHSCGSSRIVNSSSYTPYILHTHGRSGDGTAPDGAAAAAVLVVSTQAGAAAAMNVGSSSSSMVGGTGGSSSSIGPSSGSCVPTVHGVGHFNTFVKANHPSYMRQALLPPNMRDRAVGLDAAHSDPTAAMMASHRRPFSLGARSRRTSSASSHQGRVYYCPSVSSVQAVSRPSRASGYSDALRSNSMSGCHAAVGMGSGNSDNRRATATHSLSDFAFSDPQRVSAAPHPQLHRQHFFQQQQLQQPLGHPPSPASWGHLSNMPTVSLEASPHSSSPGVHTTVPGQEDNSRRHYRARSYTVGGRVRSNVDAVVVAPAAEAATRSASFSVGYVDSAASRTPDRSVSLASSTPVAAGPVVSAAAATPSGLCSHNSAIIHYTSASRAASSVATTMTAITATLPPAPSLPAYAESRASSTATGTVTPRTPRGVAAAIGATAAGGSSTRRNTGLITNSCHSAFSGRQRSVSSDVVNGLDDSVDSVRCGSLPSASNLSTANVAGSASDTPDRYSHGTAAAAAGRFGGKASSISSHRYARDSVASEDKTNDEGRRYRCPLRRHSTALTNTTTEGDDEPQQPVPQSTLEVLRGNHLRRESSAGSGGGNVDVAAVLNRARAARTGATAAAMGSGCAPTTAIERWRAQEQQRKNEEEEQQQRARQQRLSARQWCDAFRRLQEKRVRWRMRGYIGRGTSGVVYEGVLEDPERTPVAVKVLEVGVPMPMDLCVSGDDGGGASSRQAAYSDSRGSPKNTRSAADAAYMSPSQQEALLVLLREVEMMEKLHHENIVTCLRCQVTPLQDRFLELHQQHQQQRDGRRDDDMGLAGVTAAESGGERFGEQWHGSAGSRPDDNGKDSVCDGASFTAHPSPQRNPAARIPVQVEIVMELCSRGTLSSVVRRSPGGQLPVKIARRYLRDVLQGLAYLHRNNFIHRDVKGDNVLISAADVAKLADFGCSRRIMLRNNVHGTADSEGATSSSIATTRTAATDSRFTTVAEYQWFDTAGVAQTMVGTPMFMAPEIIQASGSPSITTPTATSPGFSTGQDSDAEHAGGVYGRSPPAPVGYTASADIWSFGCLILEVFGRTPWPASGSNAYHLMKQIEQSVSDLPPGVPNDTPTELLSLLRCCFHRDPQRRSTARALLRAPWMTCKNEELEEMPPRKRR